MACGAYGVVAGESGNIGWDKTMESLNLRLSSL